jgi:hypothetical protein
MKEFHCFYKNFHSLSYDDNQAAFDEEKRLNITPKKRNETKRNELGRARARS